MRRNRIITGTVAAVTLAAVLASTRDARSQARAPGAVEPPSQGVPAKLDALQRSVDGIQAAVVKIGGVLGASESWRPLRCTDSSSIAARPMSATRIRFRWR